MKHSFKFFILTTILVGVFSLNDAEAAPRIGSCPVFPSDNIWNTPVKDLPLDANSENYVASIGVDKKLHADFASATYEGSPIGIPFIVVPANQPLVDIKFKGFGDEPAPYPDESDAGPFPIPPNAPIEGGTNAEGDRHVIVVQEKNCILFELYKSAANADGSWNAVTAAKFDLKCNELRKEGWTSSDAAGLPIFPGLVRFEEVASGAITHALRFTAPTTRRAFIWPARHFASQSENANLPPMGQRFRLKASFDISGFSPGNKVILTALQTYGMILADNGSAWFISGAPDERWNDDELQSELNLITGADFEAVDVLRLISSKSSGAVAK
jgi:hypothetical protein